MTSVGVFSAWLVRDTIHWHMVVRRKPRKRVRVLVKSDESQIPGFRWAADDKAYMAACVSKNRSRSDEFVVALGVSVGTLFGTWGHVKIPMKTSFLGFGCERPWITSLRLVSSSKASICTDLIRSGTNCLGLRIWTQ